jgi:hypothetical protein
VRALTVTNPEQKNYAEILRLEARLHELRAGTPTELDGEALREAGLEIALAVREVGAMLVNIGWEQTYPRTDPGDQPDGEVR